MATESEDVTVTIGEYKINMRAAAIVRSGRDLLLCRSETDAFWYLPGGRIKAGESSREAIRREMTEELACDFVIGNPVAIAENFFRIGDESFHELCTFYFVNLKGPPDAVPLKEPGEIRRWADRDELPSLDLRPVFAKELITASGRPFRLIVHRDMGE